MLLTDLHSSRRQENVLRFDVSMNDVLLLMQVEDGTAQLNKVAHDLFFANLLVSTMHRLDMLLQGS